MQQHFNVGAIIRKAILVVADIPDDIARDLCDQFAIDHRLVAVLAKKWCLAAAFARDHDLVGGSERLAAKSRVHLAVIGNTELDVVFEKRVKHCVRNLIADFVGMTFGNRLARKQKIGVSHRCNSSRGAAALPRRVMSGWFLQRMRRRSRCGQRWANSSLMMGFAPKISPLRRSVRPNRRYAGAVCYS